MGTLLKRYNLVKVLFGGIAVAAASFLMTARAEAYDWNGAEEIYLGTLGSNTISIGNNKCANGCIGHVIEGQGTYPGIEVSGCDHIIFLKTAQLTSSEGPAIKIIGEINVEIHLIGTNNKLKGGTERPGIYVDPAATLTVSSEQSNYTLDVEGGQTDSGKAGDVAGIGGYDMSGFMNAGTVNITGGTITATGSGTGAGIGGAGSGTIKAVTISGDARVTATGGNDTAHPGSGIGNGGENSTVSGTLTVGPDAAVYAYGGKIVDADGNDVQDDDGEITQHEGITCKTILSTDKEGATIYTNGIAKNTSCSTFNGIICNEETGEYFVYGTARWPESVNLAEKVSIELAGNNATLIFEDKVKFVEGSLITGSGKVINLTNTTGLKTSGSNVQSLLQVTNAYIEVKKIMDSYTGEDLTSGFWSYITPSEGEKLDIDGWSAYAYKKDEYTPTSTANDATPMIDPGEYRIVLKRDGYDDIPLTGSMYKKNTNFDGVFTVTKKDLGDSDVIVENLNTSRTYTGTSFLESLRKEITVTVGKKTLTVGEDYNIEINGGNGTDVGTVSVAVKAIEDSQFYTGEQDGTFEVTRASLGSADIKLTVKDVGDDGEETSVYTGNKKEVIANITYGGNSLTEGKDYTLKYNKDMCSARSYEVTIAAVVDGEGNPTGNFSGEITQTVTISKRKVSIESVIPGYDEREYDGTVQVPVSGINLKNIADSESSTNVRVDPASYNGVGEVESKKVGEYSYIYLEGMELTGTSYENYDLSLETDNQYPLDFAVKITPAEVGTPVLECVETTLDEESESYTCKLQITEASRKTAVRYEYRISAVSERSAVASLAAKAVDALFGWDIQEPDEEPVFEGLIPGREYTFQVEARKDTGCKEYQGGNWTDGEVGECTVALDKLPQAAPEKPQLQFRLDDDSDPLTFIMTIPEIEGCEYCLDGDYRDGALAKDDDETVWSDERTLEGLKPGSECTVYIRYAEDDIHAAGQIAKITETVPDLVVENPVIESSGGTVFVNETKITITCNTSGATIYYTLDGSDPTEENGTEYKKSFKLTGSTTIKAIAVRDNMDDSEVVTMELVGSSGSVDTIDLDIEITDDEIAEKLEKEVGDTATVEFKRVVSDGISSVPEGLADQYEDVELITAALANEIMSHDGYKNYLNIAYYDISLYYVINGEEIRVTAENFPDIEGGFPIEIQYPDSSDGKDSVYIAAHMFGEDMGSNKKAGDIETSLEENDEITKGSKTISFTVTGTSPLGVAWKALTSSSGGDDDDDSNSSDNNTGDNSQTGDQNSDETNNSASNPETTTSDGTSNTANDGNTTTYTQNAATDDDLATDDSSDGSSDGSSGSGSSDGNSSGNVAGTLASAIQTGDVAALLPWIIGLAVSLGIVIGIVRKRRR